MKVTGVLLGPAEGAPCPPGQGPPAREPASTGEGPQPLAWRHTLAVACGSFLFLAAWAGLRPLFLPDEGRYGGVAREMLLSGDALTPTLGGLPYFHKPPLFYWITAGSMAAFGLNEWAARLAPLLGASLGAAALHRFVHRWDGPRRARLALAALLVQPLWFMGGQFANMDMLVAGCITAATLLLADSVRSMQAGLAHRPALLGAWSAMALGVLAKGLIGVVLPVLVASAWLLITPKGAGLRLWRALWWWPAPALAAAVAAPWFVAMAWKHPGFLEYMVLEQHVRRYVASGFNNPQPWWFCAAALLLFSASGLEWLWRSCRRRQTGLAAAHADTLSLMRVWVVAVVVFFSVPQSKLVGYVLPAVPALAVLMAAGMEGMRRPGPWPVRRWALSWGAALALSLGLTVGVAWQAPKSSKALGQALRAQRLPAQPVWLLGVYPFDLAFYAGLEIPARVVDHWDDPALTQRDNWHKELADAQRFAPAGSARILVQEREWAALLCKHAISWVIGPAGALPRWPVLEVSLEVARGPGDLRLWRVNPARPETASRLGCTQEVQASVT